MSAKIAVVGRSPYPVQLIQRILKDAYFEEYDTLIEESWRRQFTVKEKPIIFEFSNAIDDKTPTDIKNNAFNWSNVILILYSNNSLKTFEEAEKWVEEVKQARTQKPDPIIGLVMPDGDVELERIDVPTEGVDALKTTAGPNAFAMDVSSRTGDHINELIEEIGTRCREVFNTAAGGDDAEPKKSEKQKCNVQ